MDDQTRALFRQTRHRLENHLGTLGGPVSEQPVAVPGEYRLAPHPDTRAVEAVIAIIDTFLAMGGRE